MYAQTYGSTKTTTEAGGHNEKHSQTNFCQGELVVGAFNANANAMTSNVSSVSGMGLWEILCPKREWNDGRQTTCLNMRRSPFGHDSSLWSDFFFATLLAVDDNVDAR